jgi:hypothetical protein
MPRELVLTGGSARVAPDVMAWAGCRADGSRRAHRGTLPHPHHCLDLDAPQPAWLVERTHGTWCAGDARDAQGYTLTIARTSEGDLTASIDAASRAGLRSARATLVQLLRVCASDQPGATTVPCCVVRDAPAFATRGVLLDVSRCRVPRMDELLGVIDTLALLKCNHLQLYTEHTFAYSFGEDVWRGWSPITPDELRRLDAHCHTLGIDLAANQNCFGHLRHWLESPRFASLAETHGDWMFDVWPRSGPFSLCPTDPASRTFVRSMLAELLPCVRSGWVNIGCDETYDIAFGRSRDECTRQGRERVYARFVAQVVQDARALGKRSMFWGDVALTNPQCLDDIPRDAALLAWGYEPDAPFARWLEAARGDDSRHAEPREAWVCPGTSAWRSITGRTKERRGNIDRAARDGAMHDAAGILICEWGDMGHWQQWPVSALALGEALDAAWIGGLRQDDAGGAALDARATLAGAAAVHALGEDPDVGAWLADLGDADAALRRVCGGLSRPDRAGGPLPNASALFADLAHPFAATPNASNTHPAAPPGSREEWALVQARVDDATAALTRLNVRSPLVRDELAHTVTLARFACARALARRGHTTSVDLAAWRDSLAANHARLWRARSRLGGLDASLDYFARIDVGGSTAGGSTP